MNKILETTLRDGSYVMDFQITSRDTGEIASALEKFGFEFIEIGHGLGLNASNCGKGQAAATDEDYMKAVSKVLKRAKWGMFFIPGIGRFEDIDMAVDYDMGFIRVGTNINESEGGLKYIEYAKKRGLYVSSNLMKSYAASPAYFAERAKQAHESGADIICLVDSAGGMLPENIENYFNEAKEKNSMGLGFHGHNNLSMAVANSLKALECGALMVDSSLQGLGRGGGNASTEILVSILMKKGLFENYDLYGLLDFSNNFIRPFLRGKGIDGVNLISGHALFHSSFFPAIQKYAKRHNVDPRELIVELCKIDVVNAPDELIDEIGKKLKREKYRELPSRVFNKKLYDIERDSKKTSLKKEVASVVKEITVLAKKYNRYSVFNIVTPVIPRKKSYVSRFIQESPSFVTGSCEVANKKDLSIILDAVDDKVEIIFYDAELKHNYSRDYLQTVREKIRNSILLFYRDTEIWAKAIENLVVQLSGSMDKKVLLVGNSALAPRLLSGLSDMGYKVFVYEYDNGRPLQSNMPTTSRGKGEKNIQGKMDIIIGIEPFTPVVDGQFINLIKNKGIIIDGGIGCIAREVVDYAMKKKINVIRTDMRGVLDAEIRGKLNTYELVSRVIGRKNIAGIECVAGGIYGKENSVVLDSIKNPRCIIGVADGSGQVRYFLTDEEKELVRKVEKEIFSM